MAIVIGWLFDFDCKFRGGKLGIGLSIYLFAAIKLVRYPVALELLTMLNSLFTKDFSGRYRHGDSTN
jgi:hypothetical protein